MPTIKLTSTGKGLPLPKRLLSSEPQSTDPPEDCFPKGLPIDGSGEPSRDDELGGEIPGDEMGYKAPRGLAVIDIARGGRCSLCDINKTIAHRRKRLRRRE